MTTDKNYRKLVLLLLTLVYAFNFIDRQIVGILAPFIQADLNLTNTEVGMLTGLLFATFYTLIAIPIALMADRLHRINIIAIALTVWSGFTALTGFATSFLQIGLARMGVGIGEAGGSPPSHSVISDYYPKEQRASALGIYSLGIPVGIMFAYFVVAMIAGQSTENVPWRKIFVILGVVGIGLALIVRLVLREPVRGAMEAKDNVLPPKAPFRESIATLLTIPSWWTMCLGIATASFVAYALSAFQTKYLISLDPDFNFQTLMISLGVINGIAYAGGTYFGAKITDKWSKTNIRAYGLVPAFAVLLALPLGLAALWTTTVWTHLALISFFLVCLGAYLGPSFAIAQTLAPIHMRALSTALFFFILNMIALGGGPTITGILIDKFLVDHDNLMAIRLAFSCVSIMFVFSAICFFLTAKYIPKDWADAKTRNEGIANSPN
ncbi:MAG: MFS transporter [Robiginitomaculum sp.]|nr:MAG: MFS transporter [Robiginitomaculum sp.]